METIQIPIWQDPLTHATTMEATTIVAQYWILQWLKHWPTLVKAHNGPTKDRNLKVDIKSMKGLEEKEIKLTNQAHI